MAYTDYELKSALPNKSYNEDGTTTDLLGNPVQNPVQAYENKQALPNKWLNPDGSYSTLLELISGAIDTNIFVVVEELPQEGEPNKIYLVPNESGELMEYCWVNNEWDPIGMLEFDLSQYSTTDEMNAAILAALNAAKDYADMLLGNVVPRVYYLKNNPTGTDSNWNATAVAELQAIRDTNSDDPCIIMAKGSATGDSIYYSKTHKISGTLIFNMIKHQYEDSGQNGGMSYTRASRLEVYITIGNDGKISKVSSSYTNAQMIHFIDPTVVYQQPFTPTAPGHPATKKYVDDQIDEKVLSMLGGSY